MCDQSIENETKKLFPRPIAIIATKENEGKSFMVCKTVVELEAVLKYLMDFGYLAPGCKVSLKEQIQSKALPSW